MVTLEDLTPLFWYTQVWVNRRSRRAYLHGRMAAYYWYYRNSYDRCWTRQIPQETFSDKIEIIISTKQ